MGDYTSEIATALELIAEAGGDMILRRYAATPDATKPWLNTSITPTDYTVKGVLFGRVSRSDGTRKDTLYLAASGLPITPTRADKVVIASIEREVTSVEVTAPDGTPIYYVLELDAWPPIDRP